MNTFAHEYTLCFSYFSWFPPESYQRPLFCKASVCCHEKQPFWAGLCLLQQIACGQKVVGKNKPGFAMYTGFYPFCALDKSLPLISLEWTLTPPSCSCLRLQYDYVFLILFYPYSVSFTTPIDFKYNPISSSLLFCSARRASPRHCLPGPWWCFR